MKYASFLATSYLTFTNDLVAMATSLEILSTHIELSYGEKISIIGPVCPEIFDVIR